MEHEICLRRCQRRGSPMLGVLDMYYFKRYILGLRLLGVEEQHDGKRGECKGNERKKKQTTSFILLHDCHKGQPFGYPKVVFFFSCRHLISFLLVCFSQTILEIPLSACSLSVLDSFACLWTAGLRVTCEISGFLETFLLCIHRRLLLYPVNCFGRAPGIYLKRYLKQKLRFSSVFGVYRLS